ncbi:hypothetical protein [Sneathiella aquimaris]|uniref:hypothetical protein n=1 Tax=Sneathiella aquimaris TaxID=2599305 RepID=UPI00146ABE10|nr:hypothetical protein [Sneathiella aquimaris]
MKKFLRLTLISTFAGLFSIGMANAATFDYAAIADAPPGEMGGQPLIHSDGGVTVEARGYLSGAPAYAYLDSGSAGMGVCSTGLTGTLQCVDSSDDNVTTDETLELTFNKIVTIDSIAFADSVHGTAGLVGGVLALTIDGSPILGGMSLDPADWGLFAGLTGTVFEFSYVDTQFYLEAITVSAVPLPPALLLFGAALAGLGWIGRRRKQS